MSEDFKKNTEVTEETAAETETKTPEKPLTDNDEIKAFQKEVLGKPDNPLVVHKKGDASYEEDSAAFEMEQTHYEETKPTLQRHRFKKDPGEKGNGWKVFLVLLLIAAIVFGVLFATKSLPFQKQAATEVEETTEETTTSIEEKYRGCIVIKDTYIFVDGHEVNGIEGLQSELKYKDASTKAYTIITEHAEPNFLNYDVYPILTDMGFFGDDTEVKPIEKTGLMAQEEIEAEQAATATTEATTAETEAAADAAEEPAAE